MSEETYCKSHAQVFSYRDSLLILPSLHHLPESSKLTDMIRIMISHDKDFAKDILAVPMRNGRIQIYFGSDTITSKLCRSARKDTRVFPRQLHRLVHFPLANSPQATEVRHTVDF